MSDRLPAEEAFHPPDRFTIQRRLGAGGMGVVYQALDRERGDVVALKTLRDVDAGRHRSLQARVPRARRRRPTPTWCRSTSWSPTATHLFFTMELVRGAELLALGARAPTATATTPRRAPSAALPSIADPTAPQTRGAARLQSSQPTAVAAPCRRRRRPRRRRGGSIWRGCAPALRQLAEGVAAIHAAGMLHRDLKPSNVLVTDDGRGQDPRLRPGHRAGARARGARRAVARRHAGVHVARAGRARCRCRRASDWYAVGVMLYEALTGRLPFIGAVDRRARWTSSASSRRRRASCRPRCPRISTRCASSSCGAIRRRGRPRATCCAASAARPRSSRSQLERLDVRRRERFVGRERADGARSQRGVRGGARGPRASCSSCTAARAWARARWCAASSTIVGGATARWC